MDALQTESAADAFAVVAVAVAAVASPGAELVAVASPAVAEVAVVAAAVAAAVVVLVVVAVVVGCSNSVDAEDVAARGHLAAVAAPSSSGRQIHPGSAPEGPFAARHWWKSPVPALAVWFAPPHSGSD